MRVRPRAVVAFGLVVAFAAAGCAPDEAPTGEPQASGPSGALGVVTQPAADGAVTALCRMLTTPPEHDALTGLFENRAHRELHVIAAATQERDRTTSGALLIAKERVEADLAGRMLPPVWRTDTLALLRRTRDALLAIGLDASPCAADAASVASSPAA